MNTDASVVCQCLPLPLDIINNVTSNRFRSDWVNRALTPKSSRIQFDSKTPTLNRTNILKLNGLVRGLV